MYNIIVKYNKEGMHMAIVKNPITGEELKVLHEYDGGYTKVVEDKKGNRYLVDFYGNVKTDDHDHYILPLNDGVGKLKGHEYGDKEKKF